MSHLKTMNKIQFILPLPKLQAASLLRSYTEMQDLSLLQLHGCTCRELQLSFAGCISSADLICMTVFMIHFVCMTTQLDLLKAIRLHASFNMWSITFSSSEPRSRVKYGSFAFKKCCLKSPALLVYSGSPLQAFFWGLLIQSDTITLQQTSFQIFFQAFTWFFCYRFVFVVFWHFAENLCRYARVNATGRFPSNNTKCSFNGVNSRGK